MCAGNVEAAPAFEHGVDVVDADAFEQPEMSGSDIDGALGVIERVGLVGAASGQLPCQLRSVLTLAKLARNPCPIGF